jgi:hypothetical protein
MKMSSRWVWFGIFLDKPLRYFLCLKCIIPAIEGLLPPAHEPLIITLLFVLAQWHGLAKLRRHTNKTIDAFRHTTTWLGHKLREFRRYTSEFEVYETPKEVATRQRRTCKKARPRAALTLDSDCFDEADKATPAREQKYFNLETSKLHALWDYPDMIETFGTTDSFSTQTVSVSLVLFIPTDLLYRASFCIPKPRGATHEQMVEIISPKWGR